MAYSGPAPFHFQYPKCHVNKKHKEKELENDIYSSSSFALVTLTLQSYEKYISDFWAINSSMCMWVCACVCVHTYMCSWVHITLVGDKNMSDMGNKINLVLVRHTDIKINIKLTLWSNFFWELISLLLTLYLAIET